MGPMPFFGQSIDSFGDFTSSNPAGPAVDVATPVLYSAIANLEKLVIQLSGPLLLSSDRPSCHSPAPYQPCRTSSTAGDAAVHQLRYCQTLAIRVPPTKNRNVYVLASGGSVHHCPAGIIAYYQPSTSSLGTSCDCQSSGCQFTCPSK